MNGGQYIVKREKEEIADETGGTSKRAQTPEVSLLPGGYNQVVAPGRGRGKGGKQGT